ncbi:MAG TPA: arginyltransferase [Sphingopyxis sp.]|nr:arginyltransferase [Sphingopyxis sp.]
MTAPHGFPRFFVTSPAPCPYLDGRTERKMFTELGGHDAHGLNDALGRIGFRRSQSVSYRPSCSDCTACVSVRVCASEYQPSQSQKRTFRRNRDLIVMPCKPWATEEQYALLRSYILARHPDGGMADMDEQDFADMVEQTPVDTMMMEYREANADGSPGALVGCCLTDQLGDGLSMIYSFFDTGKQARNGLGTHIIVDHIQRAAQLGLPYVYLGYWIEGSDSMNYKTRFQPLEKLGHSGWTRFNAA